MCDNNTIINIQKELFALSDESYKNFHAKLIPTVPKETIIGIRTPILRKYAKEFFKDKRKEEFLKTLPHEYYEENNLHGFLIEQIKDYDECIEAIETFLPYVDNWATCDLISPKVFIKHKDKLIEKVKVWIVSDKPFVIRFAVNMLMKHFLDGDFNPEYLSLAAEVECDEYYVRMVIAWYFATALAKQYNAAIGFLTDNKLSVWVHNKTIQKAAESFRITAKQKDYLRSLKRKA